MTLQKCSHERTSLDEVLLSNPDFVHSTPLEIRDLERRQDTGVLRIGEIRRRVCSPEGKDTHWIEKLPPFRAIIQLEPKSLGWYLYLKQARVSRSQSESESIMPYFQVHHLANPLRYINPLPGPSHKVKRKVFEAISDVRGDPCCGIS